MKKWEKTCLTAGTIAAGALGAASWAVGKIAMDVALDRALPPAVMKKSGEMLPAEVAAAIESLEPAIRELEKEAHETVTITAWDGTKLVGHWFRREHARRTMIGVHGWRASWSRDFCASYRFWREHQCNILYIELRGQGSSGGAHMAFGLLEQFDCLDWIRWVNGTLGEALPVYLNGISMGAATVLMAAGLTLPANVRGVMADCGYTSPEAVWKYVIEKQLRLPYGVCRWAVKRACRKKLGVAADSASASEAMRRCKIPVLFVHGGDDPFVPVEMTYENYAACAAPKHLLIVPGASHGLSYLADRAAYEQSVVEFWERYDR